MKSFDTQLLFALRIVELTLRVDNPARDTAPYAQSRKEPEAK
jgi:hypothetical protein